MSPFLHKPRLVPVLSLPGLHSSVLARNLLSQFPGTLPLEMPESHQIPHLSPLTSDHLGLSSAKITSSKSSKITPSLTSLLSIVHPLIPSLY